MDKLTFREVHLDFHTGEDVPNIGLNFKKEEFEEMLKIGHINSINIFAKCHHGMFYYYDSKFSVHPNLKVDLLPQMIEVCEKNNVQYCVYISAGLDDYNAKKHPEWLMRDEFGNTTWTREHLKAGYRLMCFNTPYLDLLLDQTKEIVTKFPHAQGYFFDICDERICYCESCMEDYKRLGIDPVKDKDKLVKFSHDVYKNYYTKINNLVHSINPTARIYHNMGNIVRDRKDFLHSNTHIEIESLPTGSWGYDHFPLCCTYARRTGMDYVAHTGKFHTMWGDFGGFKHPNALVYETALHGAFGSKSCVGDQLHPSGTFDRYTYECIGKAYEKIEELEPWLTDTDAVVDIGIISQDCIERQFCPNGDTSANRIMLQGKYQFDLLDSYSDFNRYKVIILPDKIVMIDSLYNKLKEFVKNGGKLLASGTSATKDNKFVFDLGARMIGEDEYRPTFASPNVELKNINGVKMSMYEKAYNIESTGEVLVDKYEPYFQRTVQHFCSHLYTPYDPNKKTPGVTRGKDGIYIAWDIFEDFAKTGALWMKEIVLKMLDILLDNNKCIETDLPSNGVITLLEQKDKKRYVNHILYVTPTLRGSVQVIEDILPIYDINVSFKTDKKIKRCYKAPSMEKVDFKQVGNKVSYIVDEINCQTVVVCEYD